MMALIIGPVEEGKPSKLVIVLEPENLMRLRHGQPIIKPLSQFFPDKINVADYEIVIAYTPDIEFVTEQITATGSFGKAMDDSMNRPSVFRRGDVADVMSKLL